MMVGSECNIFANNLELSLNEIYILFDENIQKNVFDFKNNSIFHLYVNFKKFYLFVKKLVASFLAKFQYFLAKWWNFQFRGYKCHDFLMPIFKPELK